jgi:hypothetical protein
MTAVAPLARSARLVRPGRVLRLEIRRSVVPWAIPLIAALFLFDVYRTAAGYPPMWNVRASVITKDMITDYSIFAAGLGAWVGSREGRRKTGDLLTTTVRPAWARQATALTGTLFWLVLTFLAGVAVIYVQTAIQATWGGPPLWPVAVGVAGVVTACVIGFTAGVLVPGRFTAPLVAVGVVVLNLAGFHAGLNVSRSDTTGLLSPATASPPVDYGVFYHVPPDVAIAQLMFMGGLTLAVLGVLTLVPVLTTSYRDWRSAPGRAGRWLCAAGVALLAAGVAASWTAFALAGTAKVNGAGYWEIPALHDAASDQPAAYTPDCTGTAFKVCVHPAFGAYLRNLASTLDPVAAEIAGLPGAPAGARQVLSNVNASSRSNPITGNPPVFTYTGENVGNLVGVFWGSTADARGTVWIQGFQAALLDAFVTGQPPAGLPAAYTGDPTNPAQQAVVNTLLTAIGSPPSQRTTMSSPNGKRSSVTISQIEAATRRFAALSPAARHAWLAANLPALRAGQITLAQLP